MSTAIGDYLKRARESKDIKKWTLAEKSGVSHTEIHRIENGDRKNPSIPKIKALCDALHIPIEEALRAGNYLPETEENLFAELKDPQQIWAAKFLINTLAANRDLSDEDYNNLVDHMVMFMDHVKKKKEPKE